MTSLELFIDLDGNVEGVHDNFIDRLDLGSREISRFSEVEFNNVSQLWEATKNGSVIAQGHTREEVLKKELEYAQDYLNNKYGYKKN